MVVLYGLVGIGMFMMMVCMLMYFPPQAIGIIGTI